MKWHVIVDLIRGQSFASAKGTHNGMPWWIYKGSLFALTMNNFEIQLGRIYISTSGPKPSSHTFNSEPFKLLDNTIRWYKHLGVGVGFYQFKHVM